MPIKSEITGVLKGLGFEEKDFEKQVSTLSGGQKTPCSSWPSSSLQSGYHPSGRAHQPSGYGIHRLAGNLSSQLSGSRVHRIP